MPVRKSLSLTAMKEFRDLDVLLRLLTKAIECYPESTRRAEFAAFLVAHMEFRQSDADLYTSVVLGRNSDGSAARAHMFGMELTGQWGRGSDAGSVGTRVVTKQWSWTFREDLVYEYKYEAYEGYVNPFGGGYSVPSSNVQRGVWAPGDDRGANDELSIVIFPYGGGPRKLRHRWADSGQRSHQGCWIDNDRYGRLA